MTERRDNTNTNTNNNVRMALHKGHDDSDDLEMQRQPCDDKGTKHRELPDPERDNLYISQTLITTSAVSRSTDGPLNASELALTPMDGLEANEQTSLQKRKEEEEIAEIADTEDDNESGDLLMPLPKMSSSLRQTTSQNQQRQQQLIQEQLHTESIRHKVSCTVDLETGRKGSRAQCAVIRDKEDSQAHCRRRRMQRRVPNMAKKPFSKSKQNFMGGVPNNNNNNNNHDSDDDKDHNDSRTFSRNHSLQRTGSRREMFQTMSQHSSRKRLKMGALQIPRRDDQYKLVSFDVASQEQSGPKWYGQGLYGEVVAQDEDSCNCLCGRTCNPNQLMISYLFWAFRSSFMAVLLSAALWFIIWTMAFAVLIFMAGWHKPQCIHSAGVYFGANGTQHFLDAYALSWSTFSTVGYGAIHPVTSATVVEGSVSGCSGIEILTALEAFVGILFASFWGAIFLQKVTRVASFAQVEFSDPLLIQYGPGVGGAKQQVQNALVFDDDSEEEPINMDLEMHHGPKEVFKHSDINCPILEFRVLNRLQKKKGGEIIDAVMNIVASVDSSQAVKKKPRNSKRRKYKRQSQLRSTEAAVLKDLEFLDSEEPTADEVEKYRRRLAVKLAGAMSLENAEATSPTAGEQDIYEEKVFVKVVIESQEHPFFKRLWLARHILDHDSPLLRPEARDLIRLNSGRWPEELSSSTN
jgi:hypothetical protein